MIRFKACRHGWFDSLRYISLDNNLFLQVAVPYKFHRFIIGQKGMGVREMMNTYDVNIRVPSKEAKSDLVIVSGVPSNVEAAKV